MQLKESGIPRSIGIWSTSSQANPVPDIRNLWRGIYKSRLSWIPLLGANCLLEDLWRETASFKDGT